MKLHRPKYLASLSLYFSDLKKFQWLEKKINKNLQYLFIIILYYYQILDHLDY